MEVNIYINGKLVKKEDLPKYEVKSDVVRRIALDVLRRREDEGSKDNKDKAS